MIGYPWPDPTNEEIGRLKRENADLRAALGRVEKLHRRSFRTATMNAYCIHCGIGHAGDVPWPCATIRALEGTEQ